MEKWRVTEEKVQLAIKRIVEVANPQAIILFGSYIKGNIGFNSDLDVFVLVNESIINCRKESIRIRNALRGILMPMDIIVVRHNEFYQLAAIPGLIYGVALREGKVTYERAA